MVHRPSRLRRKGIAPLVRETSLHLEDLICPLFVDENLERPTNIASLPEFDRHTVESAVHEAGTVADLGIPAILLFGVPRHKDETGSASLSGVVQDTISEIKRQVPGVTIIADVCLCEYTSHGHCGVVDEKGVIMDEPTLEMLKQIAVTYAEAGVDVVAPSGMIDGMVAAIRAGLDEGGFKHTPIMSYAVKYCSNFYEPFRDAVDSSCAFVDRSQHQMDPANTDEAIREVRLDVREGADIIMIKPALPYLDIIYRIKQTFTVPIAAYSVSGEYIMLHGAITNSSLRPDVINEVLLSIRRAGADMIVTYFAKEAARHLRQA
ncbi:MAG: porphobilinogen synthase [Euryarchaeota archaeon]|nr:porphobilinogen synthase [Euryarchaeota archaeon]